MTVTDAGVSCRDWESLVGEITIVLSNSNESVAALTKDDIGRITMDKKCLINYFPAYIRLYYQLILMPLLWIASIHGSFAANTISEIDYSEGNDISGLVICDKRLYAILDNDDFSLYTLATSQSDGVKLLRDRSLSPSTPPTPDYSFIDLMRLWIQGILGKRYDWEGMACVNKQLVLLSESYSALYFPDKNIWLKIDTKELNKRGLLKKYNAFFEGIAIGGGSIYLAVEREPRGIVKISEAGNILESSIEGGAINGLPIDWSDLSYWNGNLYGLYRNQNKVCLINKKTLIGTECIGFDDLAKRAQYSKNSPYGLAEGLAITDDKIYIVLDNNGDKQIGKENDRRSYLFVLPNTFIPDLPND